MTRQNGDRRGTASAADVPYYQPLFGSSFRPNTQMPIEAHQLCGQLLKEMVIATEERAGAVGPLNYVRGTLDDWVMREYDRDNLDDATFVGLYMPGPHLAPQLEVDACAVLRNLDIVKAILVRHYPDCRALRICLRQLERAAASIATWNGKPRRNALRRAANRPVFRPGPPD